MLSDSDLSLDGSAIISHLRERLSETEIRHSENRTPFVTLTYAQSLDGSIAAERGRPLSLSNPHSQALTHELRAAHDAVLVGINTVLSDDPQLTVRLASGRSPQPIVLDGRLRFPHWARLLREPCVPPIIATTTVACAVREGRLHEAGARVIRLPSRRNGFVNLRSLLTCLYEFGVRSLMVEGGSRVITNFLSSEMVDQLIITIVPQVVGGLRGVHPFSGKKRNSDSAEFTSVRYHSLANDLIVCADLDRPMPSCKNRLPSAAVLNEDVPELANRTRDAAAFDCDPQEERSSSAAESWGRAVADSPVCERDTLP